jgi:hypothetical protein
LETERDEEGRCREEDVIILKLLGMKKWWEQFLSRKWLIIDAVVVYKRTIDCTNVVGSRGSSVSIVSDYGLDDWGLQERNVLQVSLMTNYMEFHDQNVI